MIIRHRRLVLSRSKSVCFVQAPKYRMRSWRVDHWCPESAPSREQGKQAMSLYYLRHIMVPVFCVILMRYGRQRKGSLVNSYYMDKTVEPPTLRRKGSDAPSSVYRKPGLRRSKQTLCRVLSRCLGSIAHVKGRTRWGRITNSSFAALRVLTDKEQRPSYRQDIVQSKVMIRKRKTYKII